MVTEESIRQKIEVRRVTLRDLDRKRDAVLAEISAFEEVLADIVGTRLLDESPRTVPIGALDADEVDEEGRVKRGLSPEWKGVMKRLARDTSFDYDAFVAAAGKCDRAIDKAGARTRVSRYLKAGYIERIEEGIFRLTQKGREAAE